MSRTVLKKAQTPDAHGELAVYYFYLATGKAFTFNKKILRRFARQACRLEDTGGPETIDGVHFDLRHSRLNPRDWRVAEFRPIIMQVPGFELDIKKRNAPSLWFPWFGEMRSKEDFNKQLEIFHTHEDLRDLKIGRGLTTTDIPFERIKDIVETHRLDDIIHAGDTIRIRDIHDILVGRTLEHDHDALSKCVFLEILRANGEVEQIKRPLIVPGHNVLLTNREGQEHYCMDLIWRMARDLGCEKPPQLRDFQSDDERKVQAAVIGAELYDLICSSHEYQSDEPGVEQAAAFKLESLNKAVALGFLWSRVEADTKMRPLAEKAIERTGSNKKGGELSGIARREKAQEGWIPIVKEMAINIRRHSPDLSQDDVVYEIQDQWEAKRQQLLHTAPPKEHERIKKLKLCKHARLKQLISAMEKAGEIQRRQSKAKKGSAPESHAA
jgi:hypothetical protein